MKSLALAAFTLGLSTISWGLVEDPEPVAYGIVVGGSTVWNPATDRFWNLAQ